MSSTTATPEGGTRKFVDHARELALGIRQRVGETEDARSLPEESVAELIDGGFPRAFVPTRFGGTGLAWDAGFDAVRELGKADASHAWCAAVMMLMSQFAAYLPIETQEELWADGPDSPIAGSILPICEVTEVDGGFRVSGNAPFASGINHSAWAFVAGFVKTPDRPKWTFFLLAPSEYTVLDTWHTIGMRGTGSNTIVADDVFVPTSRALSMEDLREGTGPGSQAHDLPLYRLPWVSFAPLSFVTPMLGATQGAFEALRDWTRERITKTGAAMADLPTVQLKMAQAAADIDASELVLRRAVGATLEPERPPLAVRARSMRDFATCGGRLRGAADVVAGLAGSAGFAEANSIQRYWRDIHFMSTHISMNDASIIHWARMELGLGPSPKQAQY